MQKLFSWRSHKIKRCGDESLSPRKMLCNKCVAVDAEQTVRLSSPVALG